MQRSPTCENCQRNYELKDMRPIGPKIPILLPCGHTFCEGCLVKAAKLKNEVSCFTCGEIVPLSAKGEFGVKNLLPNIYLLGLLAYNRRIAYESSYTGGMVGSINAFNGLRNFMVQKRVKVDDGKKNNESSDAVKKERNICDECNLRLATCQCKICDLKLCEGCFKKVHMASKVLARHQPLPLEYLSDAELSCNIHNGRVLEFYDKDTKEALCAMCAISESHKSNTIVPINDMSEESNEQLEEAIKKSKETLFWLENSSKVLTKALPEEVFESNDLFDNIHAKFTACHTLLLKRQLEMTNEASEKLSLSGSISETLQLITDQITELSSAIKDYEMLKNDKRALSLMSDKFLGNFTKLSESSCIAERIEENHKSSVRMDMSDASIEALEKFGDIVVDNTKKYELKKTSDYSPEELEELKSKLTSVQALPLDVVKTNELLDETLDLPGQKTKISQLFLPKGNFELVMVTHLKDPYEFRVQRYADKDRLQVMMTALNNHCKKSNKTEDLVYKVQEGELVCAQFMADDNWYRARIINAVSPAYPDKIPTWQNGLTIEVLYIDYGNTEWLPLNRLRKLKSQFLEIPEMAVPCSLTDIVPPFKEVTWPARSIKAFNSLTGEKKMLMNIRKRMNGKLYVDLRRPDDDEPTLDDDRPISVRDALVFLEVAVFFSPASQPNSDLHRPSKAYNELPPLKKGVFIDVVVTHVDNPHLLYIQRLDSLITNEQQYLTKLYSGRNRNQWKVDWPYRNLVVAARFSADQTWYRAVVKAVNFDETVLVEYVDYGNSETLGFNEIKKIPPMYLELPKQCWQVKLYGMDKMDGEDDWSSLAKLYMVEKLLDKPFVAYVRDVDEHGSPLIELYDTLSDRDINMNWLLIDQAFVKDLGLVKHALNDDVEKNNNQTDDVEENVQENMEGSSETPEEKNEALNTTETDQKVDANHEEHTPFEKYLPCIYPSNTFSATGVYVDQDANIYVHVNDGDDSLSELMQYLNSGIEFSSSPSTTALLHVEEGCVGKFSQDDLWYRIQVLEIESDTEVTASFIDFGNCETLHVKDISKEAHFKDVQMQCLKIFLHGVQYLDVESKWSDEAIAYLNNETVSEKFNVTILAGETNINGRLASITLADGTDLTQAMVENGFALDTRSEIRTEPANELQDSFANDENTDDDTPDPDPNAEIEGTSVEFQTEEFQVSELPISIIITQVDLPDQICIQSCNETYQEELEKLSEEINTSGFYDGIELTQPLQKGLACVAKFDDDDQYYRAKIKTFDNEIGVAEVIFMDYGNTETIPLSSLKPITADQLKLPALARKAHLRGVSPVPLPENHSYKEGDFVHQTKWLIESMKQFYNLVANKKLTAIVKSVMDDIIEIDLFDEVIVDEESGESQTVSIGELMAKFNIAQYKTS